MKKALALVVVLVMAMSLGLVGLGAAASDGEPKDVAVIIKATDSDFWQYVLVGAENYAAENPDAVTITTDGPPSEADIDQQVAILEQVIERQPDAIVIASSSSDATVPALEKAVDAGITVITIDNKVTTDKIHSHLATDNLKAGAAAADEFVAQLEAAGVEPVGKVGIISAMAGVQVIADRDEGFVTRMAEIAPDIELMEIIYVDNDMTKAMDAATNLIEANDDLIGFFADNNMTGDGTSRAITEAGKDGELVMLAFDSDPEEIKGLENGVINALVLQDPYGMGYKGVDSALKHLAGEELEPYVDTGITIVTKENMDDEDIQGLLDPMSKKIS